MRYLLNCLFISFIMLGSVTHPAAAEDQIQVYPLQALFISEKASENVPFKKAISDDNSGMNRKYAITRFLDVFKKNFPNSATTINGLNRYSTFAVFLQIPRVSQYKVAKTDKLVDLYLPMTMTISFANMGTGEVLYNYTYTYYSKREATFATLQNERLTSELYRDTFNSLLENVVQIAKENFQPFSVSSTIKKEWKGLYILDKGDTKGIAKGDTLIGPQGMPLKVIYASGDYAVAQPDMGEPKVGMVFNKLSNGNLDELKKPKVMLMPDISVGNGANIPEQMIYQLFINALGKNAAFSLISIDKGFYAAQKTGTEDTTGLTQEVTQQRELPDYYLRLQFIGPVSATIPTNKTDVSYDEHSVQACGDFLDRSGRVLYGKCVDEKITDEIVSGIRFSKEDREEVVVKNAIVKLSNDFIKAVKFKQFELPVQYSDGSRVTVADKASLLGIGGNASIFRKVGGIDGVDGEVRVPTWQLSVMGRNAISADADFFGPTTKEMPKPSSNDTVLIEGMITNVADPLKRFRLCDKAEGETADEWSKHVYYSVVQGLEYPLYDSTTFNRALLSIKRAGNGFKSSKDDQHIVSSDLGYCIEPITKATLNKKEDKDGFSTYQYSLVAGIKVHDKNGVVWKKGLKQSVTFSCPIGAGEENVQYELSKSFCNLITDLARKVEVPILK